MLEHMIRSILGFALAIIAVGCRDSPSKIESTNMAQPRSPAKIEGKTAAQPSSASKIGDKTMAQPAITKTLAVKGFDPVGEPEIRVMNNGTLLVVFNFMPPSWDENDEKCADFDKQLEKALGVAVRWEDRETFLIQRPSKDTAEKARIFLEGYKKK